MGSKKIGIFSLGEGQEFNLFGGLVNHYYYDYFDDQNKRKTSKIVRPENDLKYILGHFSVQTTPFHILCIIVYYAQLVL